MISSVTTLPELANVDVEKSDSIVTADNVDEFLSWYEKQYGSLAFVALSMKDYENLALNIADIRRFLNQQDEIIVYYEKALTEETIDEKTVSDNSTTDNN